MQIISYYHSNEMLNIKTQKMSDQKLYFLILDGGGIHSLSLLEILKQFVETFDLSCLRVWRMSL